MEKQGLFTKGGKEMGDQRLHAALYAPPNPTLYL